MTRWAEQHLTIPSSQRRSIPGMWSVAWAGEHTSLPRSRSAARRTRVCSPCFPCCRVTTGRHHGDILRQATALAEAGKLKPLLSAERFRLDTALEAHRAVESGKAPGKIVVEIE